MAQGHDIRNNPNFAVPKGWSLGDVKALRRCTNALEDDTLTLKDQSLSYKSKVTELQGLLLKGKARSTLIIIFTDAAHQLRQSKRRLRDSFEPVRIPTLRVS